MHIAKSLLVYLPYLTKHRLYKLIQITFLNDTFGVKRLIQLNKALNFSCLCSGCPLNDAVVTLYTSINVTD